MHFLTTHRLATLLAISTLILHSLAFTTPFSPPKPQHNSLLLRRNETVGSSCDSEGQWNCMTDSWQRCASGEWSKVVDCADGTRCEPSGQSMEFRIRFDNGTTTTSSSDNGSSSDAPSVAGRVGLGYGVGVAVVVFWTLAVGMAV